MKELGKFWIDRSWLETYYEIVDSITLVINDDAYDYDRSYIMRELRANGRAVLYDIAIEWTNEFEVLHADREWDGDWIDVLWTFILEKLKTEEHGKNI